MTQSANVATPPAAIEALITRAARAFDSGDMNEAEGLFKQCLELAPTHPVALHNLGLIAKQRGDHKTAETYLLRATQSGGMIASVLLLAEIYEAHDLNAEAFRYYKQILRAAPNEKTTLSKLGDLKKKMGDKEGALSCYRQAAEADPHDAKTVVKYCHELAITDQMAALARMEQLFVDVGGDLRRRAQVLHALMPLKEQALREKNGEMPYHCARRDELFFKYAADLHRDFEETHRAWLAQDPADMDALLGVGIGRFTAADRLGAEAVFEKFRSSSPTIWQTVNLSPQFYQTLAAYTDDDLVRGLPPLITLTPIVPDAGGVMYLSCNYQYFRLFAMPMLCSLADRSAHTPVHVHIMDATEAEAALAQHFCERLSPLRVGLSLERPNLQSAKTMVARCYYHAVRFIRFYQHLRAYQCPLWLMDVDALIHRDLAPLFALLDTAEVAMRIRPGRVEPWNQFNACVVGATTRPASLEYFRLIAAYIADYYRREQLRWGIDQMAMYGVYIDMEDRGCAPSLALLDDRAIDYKYIDDAFVWCNSGAAKFAHVKRVSNPGAPASFDFGGNRFVARFEDYWRQTEATCASLTAKA